MTQLVGLARDKLQTRLWRASVLPVHIILVPTSLSPITPVVVTHHPVLLAPGMTNAHRRRSRTWQMEQREECKRPRCCTRRALAVPLTGCVAVVGV